MKTAQLHRRRPLRLVLFLAGLAFTAGAAAAPAADPFVAARAVWPAGRSLEKNLQAAFRAEIITPDTSAVSLRVTASTVYRATVNGRHAGYGPARGPHGYYRVDTWNLTPLLKPGRNIVAIEVAGYNVNSYYTLDQPSFLRAEVVQAGVILAATGNAGFEALIPAERVQKAQRYSFQRPFAEAYRIRPDHNAWQTATAGALEPIACAIDARPLPCLERGVPYPDFTLRRPVRILAGGRVERILQPVKLWKDRSLVNIGPKLKGYPEGELEIIPSIIMQKYASRAEAGFPRSAVSRETTLPLGAGEFRILDFGLNNTGFIGVTAKCAEPTRLVLAFDEVLRGGDVDFKRLGCVNLVWFELPAGTFALESFEPYTFRYLKPVVLQGKCELRGIHLREYSCSGVDRAVFHAADKRLEELFEAGRQTFRQNTIDTFMDCPSRERAGWLCDSFFTARVAPDLRGDTCIEGVLMENFLLPPSFEFLPKGMLPMCYPADHNDGVFIPNWAMWFVVQLEEYLARSADRKTVDALRGRVLELLDYLGKFRNSDGLLEKLPSWVFVEWSDANKYVQDVNYPSNMLYAGTLSAASKLYDLPDLEAQAAKVRETIRKQSFDGTFFVDNAVRKPDGKLEVTRNRTEVCQYFAFFFDVATVETHRKLWTTLQTRFGPHRKENNPFPEVGLANSFIGNMLRIELLSQQGLSQQILDESIEYLKYMADRTGTLWENVGDYASCNHGFASHIVHTLFRDVLGARELDRNKKRLHLVFPRLELSWCEGAIPTPDGPVRVSWKRRGDTVEYTCRAPEGYSVKVENRTGCRLKKKQD